MGSSHRYLLDTSVFLWAGGDTGRLSRTARDGLLQPEAKRYVSVVSVWEMQIKHSQGKLPLPERADSLAARFATALRCEVLGLTMQHIARLYDLQAFHRDPFDRILVAQALAEGLTILSPDPLLRSYPAQILW
jgi:PIN domain nuclease of toxin-antitoxin system